MPAGGGKFEDYTTRILMECDADAVIVMVVGGSRGPGFSVAALDENFVGVLSKTMRDVCNQIDQDLLRKKMDG
jgi:hypothetical protein